MLHNGQEWGQFEDIWEDDKNAPPADARVQSRPLDWAQADDPLGALIRSRYAFLMAIRRDRAGLRSPNFYPDYYDEQWTSLSPDGYGIDVGRQIAIYHRWGDDTAGRLERFIVVLNFSDAVQWVDVPFPTNGNWTDLLNSNAIFKVGDYQLDNFQIPSNWGCVFFQ